MPPSRRRPNAQGFSRRERESPFGPAEFFVRDADGWKPPLAVRLIGVVPLDIQRLHLQASIVPSPWLHSVPWRRF